MNCHICGRSGELVSAEVEGAILDVCSDCSKYGKILHRPKPVQSSSSRGSSSTASSSFSSSSGHHRDEADSEEIVSDAGEKIRKQREKMKLTQEQFARKLAERESIIQKIESGAIQPTIVLARKIERQLGIKLIESVQAAAFVSSSKKSEGLTIGDLMKK